jgi:hypothetical protein
MGICLELRLLLPPPQLQQLLQHMEGAVRQVLEVEGVDLEDSLGCLPSTTISTHATTGHTDGLQQI